MTGSTSALEVGNVSKDGKDTQKSVKDEKELKQLFIGSIDQGTTSTRFLIFDGTGSPIASHQMEFKQMYPHSGSVHYTNVTASVVIALTAMQMDRA